MAAIRCLSPLLSCSSRLACRSAVRLPVPFARFSSAGRALFQARPSTLIANSKLTLAVPAGLIAWAKLKTPLTVLRCNAAIEEAVDSNDAVELSVTNQGPSSTDLLVELAKALQPDALLLLLTAATAVATAIVSLATPAATGELVNVLAKLAQAPNDGAAAKTFSELISGLSNNTALNVAAAKLFSLFLLNSWLTFAYVAMVSQVGENLAERLRGRLFSSIVRQDISFFDERKSGDLLNRLTADVQNFKSSIKSTISQGLKAVTQTIGGLVSLYLLSPPLTIFLLTTLPCLYSIGSLYGRYLRHLSETARQSDALSSSIANECLSNIRTVRAFAMEDEESETYQDALNEASYLHKLLGLHIGLFQGLNTLALSGMFLSVLYFGGYLVYRGDMTAGQLMTYLISTQTTQRALATLVVLYGSVTKALGAGSRVFEYMSRKPLVPVKGGIILSQINGDIQFHNIRFAYPSRPDRLVLDNFNFTIQQGQIVALCGLSGGGKSTIAALLERFYEPLSGTITLDGHALSSLDPSWLRSQIGYISQEPVLFGTSIYNNIRYGRPDATLEEVQEAAKQANAHEFISGFTDGYNTLVGERGVALSGGQRQRIAIARALIKNPKVLILDEATSALDAESEKLVQEALDRVMKGRTVLVIAHRLSTIKEASVICVLGKHFGNIIEKGTHSELLSKGGVYAGLYQQLQSQK